ncbi:UV excision repair protein RAD23 [Pseudoxanthobacter soli DSM 19599]|uniref:UV excision repair protein RAD23 n=1 Tax=Pseudoxanthobacter soli DSM 19599 TaxID=1123029 RepID=A0A1M7ZRV1_9HYPH|nr:hypothetical protein [Pseudoxanthobacter soli]SHO67597.1 UV excision repair protein RAD23 [Pseudoxanthobacter soli DSM 19599]
MIMLPFARRCVIAAALLSMAPAAWAQEAPAPAAPAAESQGQAAPPPAAAPAQPAPAEPAPAQPAPAPAAAAPAPEKPKAPPSPAARAECAWAGERIIGLLWRDDIRTANDFLSLYDRFECPSEHVPVAFACLIRVGVSSEQGDPGLPLRSRACWADPALDPATLKVPAAPAEGQKAEEQKPAEPGASAPKPEQPAEQKAQ